MILTRRLLTSQRFRRGSIRESKLKEQQRSLKIAIIGTPNVGKSALTNQLIKADLCAVSKLIDTTRQNMITSLSEGTCQLIVVDSPGLIGLEHAKKVVCTHSESKILVDPEKALDHADHVIVVDDVTAPGEYIHHRVLHLLHRNSHISTTLVMNKRDLIKRQSDLLKRAHTLTCGTIGGKAILTDGPRLGKLNKLTEPASMSIPLNSMKNRLEDKDPKWIESYNKIINKPTHRCTWSETKQVFKSEFGWPHFTGLFFVSAKTGEGIDGLRAHLQSLSKPIDEWKFDKNLQTTKKPYFVIAEHVRSALLNTVPADVAYKLKIKIMHWEEEDNEVRIIAHVNCDKERWGRLVAVAVRDEIAILEDRFRKLLDKEVLLEILPKFEGKIIQ